MNSIPIAIVEDNDEFREEFKSYCNQSERLDCIFAVDSTEKLMKYFSPIIQVDYVLVDLTLPELDGFEAIKHIKKLSPEIEVIVLTTHTDYDSTFKALRTGAIGYLVKKHSLEEIEKYIIDFKDKDNIPLSPQIARRILQYFEPVSKKVQNKTKDVTLSPKEIIVIKHITQGKTYSEAASLMGISTNGIRFHIKKIYKKLHIKSKGELIHLSIDGFFKKYFT